LGNFIYRYNWQGVDLSIVALFLFVYFSLQIIGGNRLVVFLSVRLFNRRFTRLTLGYSKKFEYLIHSINLMLFHFNFVKQHATHGTTPAIAAGLISHQMTFSEMLLTPD
jgi:hypothetical protein